MASLPPACNMTVDELVVQARERQREATPEGGRQEGAKGHCPVRAVTQEFATPEPQNYGTNVPDE